MKFYFDVRHSKFGIGYYSTNLFHPNQLNQQINLIRIFAGDWEKSKTSWSNRIPDQWIYQL
jgi:hypothetical protein